MTELRERASKQKAELEKRMMGAGSDDDDDEKEEEEMDGEGSNSKGRSKLSNEDSGCSWGMGELLCCDRCACHILLVICVYISLSCESSSSLCCLLSCGSICSIINPPCS